MHTTPKHRTCLRHLAVLVVMALAYGCVSMGGRTEEVSFEGGDGTTLRGTFALPEGASGALPAVVLLHGSERATRKRVVYPVEAQVFLRRGIAVLVYDKRGAGESGGDFESTTYSQLVEDALAAVSFLRGRPEIDASKIGLVGASESGWLTPEIAERSGGLAFVVNKSGPALSWRETVAWEVYNDLRAEGVDDPSAREQAEIRRRIWSYELKPTPEERAALEEILRAWAERKDSSLPATLAEQVDPRHLERIAYDPTPYLERTTTPMLYVYGRTDGNVPTEACVARLRELAEAGRPVSFHVFEGAGHELGGPWLLPPWYRVLAGYSELVVGFTKEHTGG